MVLLVFWLGSGGIAGGYGVEPGITQGGFGLVGDWALEGISGRFESGTARSDCLNDLHAQVYCRRSAQIGSVAHELGHGFGLPHSRDDGRLRDDPDYFLLSLMGAWYIYPDVKILNNSCNPERYELLRRSYFQLSANVVTPAPPNDLWVESPDATTMVVRWCDHSEYETGFYLWDGEQWLDLSANETAVRLTGLQTNAYRCFTVIAFNAAGASAPTPYTCHTAIPKTRSTPSLSQPINSRSGLPILQPIERSGSS